MRQLNLFAPQPDDDEDDDDYYQPSEPRPRPTLSVVPQTPPQTQAPTPPPPKPKANRYPAHLGARPAEAARRIAEAATDAWHQHHGGGRMDIPVGVVAALSLWPLKGPDAPLQADFIMGLSGPDLCQLMRECWAYWWMKRPDLVHRSAPIASWLDEETSEHPYECVRAVAAAAIKNGLLNITGSMDPYDLAEFDLMSWMITGLRSNGSRQWLGEFHTPSEICELLARMQLGDCSQVKPGHSFGEPAGGTGGMFRAISQVLREHQIDPRTCRWHMCEVDPIAAAGAAVNTILWDLGPRATVWCGDTLAQGDTEALALEERRAIFEYRDELQSRVAVAAAVGKAHRLLSALEADVAA